MPFTYNIEMDEPENNKKRAALLVFLVCFAVAMFLWLPGTQATYSTADAGTHIFVLAEDQDIKVGLTEPAWEVNKGLDQLPGSTLAKNPTIENQASDCYLRVNFRITEKEEGKIGSSDVKTTTINPTSGEEASKRCEAVLKMLWYDSGENLKEGTSYTTSALNELVPKINNVFNAAQFEPQFPNENLALNGWNASMQAYSFVYKNASTENVFKEGSSATFFTHLIVPADVDQNEFYLAGDYYINIWVQAIQTSPDFATREDAIAALSDENVSNNLQNIDGEEVSDTSAHRRL